MPTLNPRTLWQAGLTVAAAGLLLCPGILPHGAEGAGTAINVDQEGYPREGPKAALAAIQVNTFNIRRSDESSSAGERGFYFANSGFATGTWIWTRGDLRKERGSLQRSKPINWPSLEQTRPQPTGGRCSLS